MRMCPRRCRCGDVPGGTEGTRGSPRVGGSLAPFNFQFSGVSCYFSPRYRCDRRERDRGFLAGSADPGGLLERGALYSDPVFRSRIPLHSGGGGVEPSGFLGEEQIDPGGFPGKEARIPLNRGVGAEPGGFPGERSRWIPSWITDCSAAYPTTVPVLALSMLFAGSQLIPRDSCSLCESGCRPGPDPTQGKALKPPADPRC